MSLFLALLRHAKAVWRCPFLGAHRKWPALGQNDVIGRAPRGREPSVREGLTRIIVDWSGSWQAARPGNWLEPCDEGGLGPLTEPMGRNKEKPEHLESSNAD